MDDLGNPSGPNISTNPNNPNISVNPSKKDYHYYKDSIKLSYSDPNVYAPLEVKLPDKEPFMIDNLLGILCYGYHNWIISAGKDMSLLLDDIYNLLRTGNVDVNEPCYDGNTILWCMIRNNTIVEDLVVINLLLSHGNIIDPNITKDGEYHILCLLYKQYVTENKTAIFPIFKRLIDEHKADIDYVDSYGNSILINMVITATENENIKNNIEFIEYILNREPDINFKKMESGSTAFMFASGVNFTDDNHITWDKIIPKYTHTILINLLLDSGANSSIKNNKGYVAKYNTKFKYDKTEYNKQGVI
jgi:ankyrin repeat protein